MIFKFYKDIQIIKWCAKCDFRWEPKRYSWQNKRKICVRCVSKEIAIWRKKNPQKWNKIVQNYRKKARSRRLPWVLHAYTQTRLWVAKNPERRRNIALRSYHKKKKLKKVRPLDT